MDWVKISEDDLESVLNKRQLELIESQAGKCSERNFVIDALNSAVALVRTNIAASGVNMLDMDHSRIPPELKECTLLLALESLQARIGVLELSKLQQKRAESAHTLLGDVASGRIPVSRPIVGVRTASRKKGISSGKGSTNTFTRKTMLGL